MLSDSRIRQAAKRKLPEHMVEGVVAYVMKGLPPGSFLESVLSNDFMEAAGRADHINQGRLRDYADFLYNDAPRSCWGSPEAYAEWIKQGGANGIQAALEAAS